MIAPLLDAPALSALPVGLAFGATLERSGLGDSRTIADQLAGRDFTVVKVMFTAIITAMLLLFWTDRLGWLDLSRVGVPTTDILPQLLGSVLFGAGFALASLCPGTACVAAATGARDGLAAIGGLFLGTLVTAAAWPSLGGLAEHAPRPGALLPADLGISTGMAVGGVTIVGMLVLRLSDRFAGTPPVTHPWLGAGGIALGALSALAGNRPLASPSAWGTIAAQVAAEADHVDPVVLGEWIKDHKPGLRVVDVRDGLTPADYLIPGARVVPLADLDSLTVRPGETVVLYSDGGTHAAQGWVLLRARGLSSVYVLKDGLAAWEDEVLSPVLPSAGDSAGLARYRRARVLMQWFGGMPRGSGGSEDGPGAPGRPAPAAVHPRRRNTC